MSISLRINDPIRRDLYERSLVADECLDSDALAELWHPEGSFQLGAQSVVTGRDGVRANFAGFFSLGLFTSLTHEMLEVFDLTEILIYRALVTYLREGASPLTVPYMNAITYRDGLFDRYEVFIDTAPLFAPPQ